RTLRTARSRGTGAGAGHPPSPASRRSPSASLVHKAWTGVPARRVSTALAEERRDVELVVTEVEVIVVGRGEDVLVHVVEPEHLAAVLGTRLSAASLFPALEARRDDRDAHGVGHGFVDHVPEDDVGIG